MLTASVAPDAAPGWKLHYGKDELTEVACPVCRSARSLDIAREFGIAIARCTACGVVFTRTPLLRSQAHYAAPSEFVRAKYGPMLDRKVPHPRTPNYHEHLRLLEALTSGRDLLDVGAHCGFFLDIARSRGWRVTGVEPSPVTSTLAREELGLEVRSVALEDADFATDSFDVVTFVDVFEHLADPCGVLEEVARVLRPGGRVFVKVPNVRYVLAKQRLLGRLALVEDIFDAREHLVHYSAATLRRTLGTAGFEMEVMKVASPIQSGSSWRRALRAAGPLLARRVPNGVALPLATDIVAIARAWRVGTRRSGTSRPAA